MVEARASCHAVRCDVAGCHAEVLGPTAADALADAQLGGWSVDGAQHRCFDCVAGRSTAEARARAVYGQSRVHVRADRDYAAGAEYRVDGRLVGRVVASALAGDPVEVALVTPAPKGQKLADAPPAELRIEQAGDWTPPWASGTPS